MTKRRFLITLLALAATTAPAACLATPATIIQCRVIASETVPFPYPHDGTSSYEWDLSINMGLWNFPDDTQGYSELEDSTIWSHPNCVNPFQPYSDLPNPMLRELPDSTN